MNRREEILQKLLRMAATKEEAERMPFGFDTRVLAQLREFAINGSAFTALFARRVIAVAVAVILLATVGLYSISNSESGTDATNEYGMVDSAIQNNLE